MDLDRITALLDLLTTRWPQVLAAFGGVALAAGLLGMLTRALGAKEGDGLRRPARPQGDTPPGKE